MLFYIAVNYQLVSYGFIPLTKFHRPRPSPQALSHMLETYKQSIHLQPLPLFSLTDIEESLTNAPEFLLWSFLALTLTFSSHEFYHGLEKEAIQFYANYAEEKIMKLALEGTTEEAVVQSLCLLALRYIKGKVLTAYTS